MATITSLDFNVKSSWDGSGIREARADLDLLKADLQEIADTRAQASVGVNINKAGLDEFRAELEEVGQMHIVATATVNVNDAELVRLRTELQQVGAEHVTATASVNTDTSKLNALRAELAAVGKMHETATASVNINSANLDEFDRKLRALGNTHVTATASVNANTAALDSLESKLTRFGAMRETATASVNTNSGNLDALEARLVAFGASRHTSTADVNTDSAHTHLSTMENDLGTAIRGAGDLAAAAGGAGSAIGGLGNAAGGAGGSLGSLGGAAGGASSGFSGMASTIGLVVLALVALDAIAPIVAASVVAIPIGFIAVAGLLISKNKELKASFKDAFSHIVDTLVPLAMPVIQALLKAIQQLDGWLHLIGPAIHEAFQAAAPLVQPLLNIVEKLVGGALPGFTRAMQNMTPLLDGLGKGALKLGGYLGQMADTFAKIPGLGTAMNGIMGALGQVLLAIAQSIAKVVSTDHGQLLIQILQTLSVTIKALTPVMQILDLAFTGTAVIWRGLMDVAIALETAFGALLKMFTGSGPIVQGVTAAWNIFWGGLKQAVIAIWNAMGVAWDGMVKGLKIAWDAVSGALQTAWNTVWNTMKQVGQTIWDGMKTAWATVAGAFKTAWDAVSGALSSAWSTFWNGLKTVAQSVWDGLKTAWNTTTSALRTAWDTFSSALRTAWQAFWSSITSAAETIWNGLKTAWQAIVNGLRTAWDTFSSALRTAWQAFWSSITSAAETIWNGLKAAWQAIVNALRTAWNTFSSAFRTAWNDFWNSIKSFGETIWNGIKKAAGLVWDGMKHDLQVFVDTAKKIWHGLQEAFEAPIRFVVETVLNGGIIKAIDWVISKLGGPAQAIPPIPKPFAAGGAVSGPGTGTSDSILARLSDGEHVWTAAEVAAAGGHGAVAAMRSNVLGSSARTMGAGGMFAGGGGVGPGVGSSVTSIPSTVAAPGGAATSASATNLPSGGLSISDIESMFADIIKSIGGAGAGILAKAIGSAGSLAKAVGGGIQGASNAVGNAVSHVPGVGKPAASVIKGIGHLLGGGAKAVGSGANAIADALAKWGKKEFESAAGDLINKVIEKLPIPGGKGVLGGMGSDAAKMMMKSAANKLKGFIADFLFTKNQTNVSAHAVAGPKAVQAWAPVVLQALAMTGHPASWLAPILLMMSRESGGNPNAINKTDINAQHGIPSQGLMQVIPPTFAANHEPGTSNNILDPLANIAAAINYIAKDVGGRLGKTPYASGTSNATPGMHLVGENGPEMVMFGGGETVKNASDTAAMMNLPTDRMDANRAVWGEYVRSIATSSANAWSSIRQTQTSDLNAMSASILPFTTQFKNQFNNTGSEVANMWKENWTANETLFKTTLGNATTEANNFNSNLKKNFADNGLALGNQWKTDWETNQQVMTTDLTQTQTNASNFQTELKTNFQTTGTEVGNQWKAMWDKASTDAQTDFTTMNTASTNMWNAQKATFTAGQNFLTGTFFPPVNDLMVNKLPQSFATSVSNIGSGWIGLENATRNPVSAVVDVVYNKGIVGVWNLIAKAFGAPTLSTFTMPGFATGGAVNGPGTGTSDSIVARLSAGEHVWTAAEVSAAGGHDAVAGMRSNVLGGSARVYGSGNGRYAAGGAVVPTATGTGGNPTTPTAGPGAPAGGTTGGSLSSLASATLGSIHQIANPLIDAAVAAGKVAVDAVTVAGSGMRTAAENMGANMGKAATTYITQNDVLPTIGGGSDASAQAWADAQVGKPYALGGNFGATFDCSQYMSGIARAILGETPAPWFTTFAFNGATAPAGFKQNLQAPFMVGVTNAGVGHMAGTLNGTNYEATPPAVRKGPSARGWNDSMFPMHYGFEPSIQAATIGAVTSANHLAIIDAALAAAGVPPPGTKADWEDGMNIIITHESAWNANAINLTDSNAAAGIPSQGLAQVIPPTFSAYHVPGTSTNILDPIANVAAAIRYIVARYGNIDNVPGVASIRAGGAYLPYRNGTNDATMGWHLVGEDGPEMRWFNGGEKVWNARKTKDWMDKLANSGASEGSGDAPVAVTVENHWHGPVTKEALQHAEGPMADKLRMACIAGVGKRRH